MSDHKLNWRWIITFVALIAILIWFLILWLIKLVGFDTHASPLKYFGLLSLLIGLVWLVLLKYAWRTRILKVLLISTPDLRGRWKGYYISSYDKKQRDLVLEIRQTLLSIKCSAYSIDTDVEVYSSRLLSDKDNKQFILAYIFQSRRNIATRVPGDTHEGMAILTFIDVIEAKPKVLKGRYINDRDPEPRKGDIYLVWEDIKLKQQF